MALGPELLPYRKTDRRDPAQVGRPREFVQLDRMTETGTELHFTGMFVG